ncbi:MAG: hypothetical protein A3G33_00220 [Omnitrophica bacterium RIFCSPLOWO2_12_FULL_44_17]|uniref:Periplasmic heavy metal sensor n=1 Tax=Candidatus Danuiimicrobium aquiferis TaxID=1801832 RepID=A0A1G1L0Y9_9BACT|nr:MAG: hypothetical protein A3B72_10220 [Omnitrophica bacterium RIFCSPHIGHO2_02_FULL_45_28]OGW90772.1 MAG: hypothetical protein A3E74_05480 [Omnitrophica bacterium RIFCSPHIGHO2_12_FULL_44_12]OGW98823.1 MAG: hypothetical protein A3G33_00220 [Omnitrophica bacterium RIFCSPLOWO2_12_FULL_44_17]OGX02861.1 MAG: hypothetical protein A3J12_01615 [Omnitrophica bacterium RIFCSPLOWO2_02_FULL_44_11]
MKKQIILWMLVFVLVGGLGVSGVDAYHGMKHGKGHCGGIEDRLFDKAHFYTKYQDELGLETGQIDIIRTLKYSTKKDLVRYKAQIDTLNNEIDFKMSDDVLDLDTISRLIDQKYELEKAREKSLLQSYSQMKSMLSEEQNQKAKKLLRSKGKMMSHSVELTPAKK